MPSRSDRTRELNELADWCELVTRFVYDRPESRSWLELALDGTRRGRARGDLRGLRMAYRDTNEMARGLNIDERRKLDQLLRERFGHGLEKGDRDLKAQASAILKRGTIKKAEEYRILETRLDAILTDPSKNKEVERINTLLASVTEPLPE